MRGKMLSLKFRRLLIGKDAYLDIGHICHTACAQGLGRWPWKVSKELVHLDQKGQDSAVRAWRAAHHQTDWCARSNCRKPDWESSHCKQSIHPGSLWMASLELGKQSLKERSIFRTWQAAVFDIGNLHRQMTVSAIEKRRSLHKCIECLVKIWVSTDICTYSADL